MKDAFILKCAAYLTGGCIIALIAIALNEPLPHPLLDPYDNTLRDSAGYQLLDASKSYHKGWTVAKDGKLVKVWLEDRP